MNPQELITKALTAYVQQLAFAQITDRSALRDAEHTLARFTNGEIQLIEKPATIHITVARRDGKTYLHPEEYSVWIEAANNPSGATLLGASEFVHVVRDTALRVIGVLRDAHVPYKLTELE